MAGRVSARGMQSGIPFGVFRPGSSLLHRLSPLLKLCGLVIFAAVVVVLPWPWGGDVAGAVSAVAVLLVAVGLGFVGGLRLPDFGRLARGLLVFAVPLLVFQWWQHGPWHAVHVVGDLFAMIFVASAVSASTSPGDLLDSLVRVLGPLRRVGVRPDRVGLALALAIAAIPTVFGLAMETDAAARARGLQWSLRARVVPFVLRTVAYAQVLGDALAARGVDD